MEVVYIALKPYPSFGGQESFLILQESQTPLFQHGRILSSFLDIPRPVPLYYISCLLGSVCGVDFIQGYLYFPSTMYDSVPLGRAVMEHDRKDQTSPWGVKSCMIMALCTLLLVSINLKVFMDESF